MAKKGGHHGGAWKVAYADFVTAMMALFMVLWITAQDEEILISTSKYFQQPFSSPFEEPSNANPISTGSEGSGKHSGGDDEPSSQIEMPALNNLAQELFRLLNVREQEDQSIDVVVTSDGLRITVYDRDDETLFQPGSPALTAAGTEVMQKLAWILDRYTMAMRIDAHTAADFPGERPDFGPFELTAERAVAVRQSLVYYALDPSKVERITGFGSTRPIPDIDPASARNDRLEISLAVN